MKISDFIPPILVRIWKGLVFPIPEKQSPKFFSSYEEAQDACFGTGYQDSDLISAVFEKTRLNKDLMLSGDFPMSGAATQSLVALLLALGNGGKQLRVIDLGGACGAHYFQLRRFLPHDLKLEWIVVETPAMVKKAVALETNELRFSTSLFEARDRLEAVDLVHSSGTLQYVPAPEVTLQECIACGPAHIFLNRLALSSSETMITVQESLLSSNGPGKLPDGVSERVCLYPVTYFSKSKLIELLSQSYKVIFELVDPKKPMDGRWVYFDTSIFWKKN